MTTASSNTGLNPTGSGGSDPRGGFPVVQVGPELRLAAAMRLVGDQSPDPLAAATKFLDSAQEHGIDLTLMWCTLGPDKEMGGGPDVRQVCLAVLGTGRTAMIFVSGPRRGAGGALARLGRANAAAAAQEQRERVALVHRACEVVGAPSPDVSMPAVLAQSLLEARETDVMRALRVAGFTQLGDLAYLRRPLARTPGRALEQAGHPTWPEGINVRSVLELREAGASEQQIHDWLVEALDRSYVDTLDCPELCGLRSIEDVLESHRCVGEFDPTLWWIARGASGALGCLLLSVAPEHDSVELVYLGLAPEIRGRGLGAKLLRFGLRRLYDTALASQPLAGHPHVAGGGGVTCAVDTRNAPAMKLYRDAGFERIGVRIPLVRGLRAPRA